MELQDSRCHLSVNCSAGSRGRMRMGCVADSFRLGRRIRNDIESAMDICFPLYGPVPSKLLNKHEDMTLRCKSG